MSNPVASKSTTYPNLGDVMLKAKNENLFTDIQFVIGKDPSKKTFNAHKNILASGSPVFEKMFYGEMPEKNNPIVIEDDDPEAFDMLLNYIYGKGDKIQLNSYLTVWKFYSIGDKYLVEGITEDAERFLESSCMKEEDFWNLVQNDLITEPIFDEKLNNYINQNTDKILKSENALQMPEILVEDILQRDTLNVSECELLEFTAKWGNTNLPREGRSKQMIRLFQYIRFSVLPLEDFFAFTKNFLDFIDAKDSAKIFQHLSDKSINKLPDWCSTSDDYRCFQSYFSVLDNKGMFNDQQALEFTEYQMTI